MVILMLQDIIQFQKLDKKNHNRFQTINELVSSARQFSEDTNHAMLDSKNLSHALYGNTDISKLHIKREHVSNLDKCINSYLDYVDDEMLCNFVRISIHKSLNIGYLKFYYGKLQEQDKRRLRILCRMIWQDFTGENL